MDKIVMVTGNSEKKKSLIECLTMLFPEGEIEIRHKKTDGFEDIPLHMEED